MKQRKKPGHSYNGNNGKDNLSPSPNISNI
jgi:hypothetical protein